MNSMAIWQGDCLDNMSCLPDDSVDMVCCDMPFGTTKCKWDTAIDLERLWGQYRRIAKPNAAIVLFAQTPFDKVLGASNLEWLRYEWIWEKSAATGFFNANKMPLKAHENILVFYDKLPKYYPQKTSGHARKTASRKEIGSEVYGKGTKKTRYDSTERYPRSVQCFSKGSRIGSLHPTEKPVELIEYLVRTYTDPGDTVLGNCMGSGTTGVACRNTGRNFLGIEINPVFFDIAAQRLGL